jgi:Predicted transcriptional regulator
MAERKIFAGPRVRRVRMSMGLTQTAMAEALGISPSYLNLIERNQRPLTVQLLLKLSSVYKIDLDLLQGEGGGITGHLREVFSDPLLSGEIPGDQEIIEVSEAAPNAALGMVKLYRAYREQAARLSDLADMLAREGHQTSVAGARLPIDEVREQLERRPNFFAGIEDAAEEFSQRLSADDLPAALKAWLKAEHGIAVRTLPVHAMPNLRRRYDRHSMRLFLSERMSPFDRTRELAMEVALLAIGREISAELDALSFSTGEARRVARFELARYAAHALMMPYGAFLAAAQRVRYDVDVLRSRFDVSFEQAANRLTTLARPGAQGTAWFMLELDHAGNAIRRAGAQGYPRATFGGLCPKLGIHSAFAQPGQVLAEAVEMPDGSAFLTVSRTVEGPQAAFGERLRRTAILLGCEWAQSAETTYAQAIGGTTARVMGGPACRLCERQGCLARAEPPITRPLGLDEMVTGLSAFDFQ